MENMILEKDKQMRESEVAKLESQVEQMMISIRKLEDELESMGKQNNHLLVNNNHQSKTQYLNTQREQFNQIKKDNS